MIGLFIHIPRTGGTFLREYLKKASNAEIVQFGHWRFSSGNTQQGYIQQHLPIPKELFPLDNYFKFTFIRNPWDWYVSRYFYFCRSPVVENGLSIKCDSGLIGVDFIKRFPTFKEHMLWGNSKSPNFWLNSRYQDMCFVDGKNLINYVGKLENIEESINEVFKRCNIISQVSYQDFYRDADRFFNGTTHKHYSCYYDKELIDLVYEKDKKIITKFNYNYTEYLIS